MKLRLSNGVIVEPRTDDVAKQYLKYGATEVTDTPIAPKKQTKRSVTKVSSTKEAE